MSRISTHVLDITRGKPANGVPVRLEKQESPTSWRLLQAARTDDDGRCPQLLPADELQPGLYRLVFDTATYFSAMKIEALHPIIEIAFQVRAGESHFHIPLLLSANAYTTYRGS